MLQQIRDRTTGLIAGFIVAIIVVPFAFFGIESFFSGGGDPVVAKVGSEKIHQSQFRRQYEQRYQQLVQLMGEHFRADMINKSRLQNAVIHDMTQESMLRQYAESEGYRADDGTLFKSLSKESAFQGKDGKFDTETYKAALSRAGYTPERFEAQLRNSIEMDQMRSTIVDTGFITQTEATQAARLAHEQRTIQYAVFDLPHYRDRVTVSDDEVKARYDETKTQYQAPERIKLSYVELSLDGLPPADPPSEDVLKVLYEAEKAGRFTTQEERHASHILISFGADKAAAKAKAEELDQQIKAGADFAKLAKEYSKDPGSKDKGGDLGWVKLGQMVKPFEKVLFSLKKGEVSGPVETEFGWHLIKLDDVKPSVVRPFSDPEVKRELTELFQNRERQKRFQEDSDKLEQLAFENPASLEPVAEALGLKVQSTDWIVRGKGTGIAANEAVSTAAFSPEVVQDGENSKPLSIGDNKIVVIRKSDYEAPRQKSLEEVAATVRDVLVDEAARKMAAQDAQEVLNAVRGGTDFQQIVLAKKGEMRNPGAISRDDKKVEPAVVDKVFTMARPAPDKTVYVDAELKDGGQAVIALSKVGEPPQTNAAEMDKLRQQLRDREAGGEFQSYLSYIEQKVGVKVEQLPEDDTPDVPGS